MESWPDIVLYSPAGNKQQATIKGQKVYKSCEIIDTIRFVAEEFLYLKPTIDQIVNDLQEHESYQSIKQLCEKYNKIINEKTCLKISPKLFKHINNLVYNTIEPKGLTKKKKCQDFIYGETTLDFIQYMIEQDLLKPKEGETFVDLGSGVGNIVRHIAATLKCNKCYGIELDETAANFSKQMEHEFKFWMEFYGKTYTEFELIYGNFFDLKYRDIIKSADYIFINNFKFSPDTNEKLKLIFQELKYGTKIISSVSFTSKRRSLNYSMNGVCSAMRVTQITPPEGMSSASWTPTPIPYYLHVIDKSVLNEIFEDRNKIALPPKKRRKK